MAHVARFAVCCCLLGGGLLPLAGQVNLQGSVYDLYTGRPLAGAQLEIAGLNFSGTSDRSGYFLLQNIPSGTWQLTCSAPGYAPRTRSFEADSTALISVGFGLFPALGQLLCPPAAGMQRRLRSPMDAPGIVHSLSQPAIRQELPQSVHESWAALPGVWNLSQHPALAQPSVRGMSGDRLLILQDGIRLGPALMGSALRGQVIPGDPYGLERVELLPAGAPAFGTEAAAALALFSQPARFSGKGLKASGEVMGFWVSGAQGQGARAAAELRSPRAAFSASLRGVSAGDWLLAGRQPAAATAHQHVGSDLRLAFRIGQRHRLDLVRQEQQLWDLRRYDFLQLDSFARYQQQPRHRLSYARWTFHTAQPLAREIRVTAASQQWEESYDIQPAAQAPAEELALRILTRSAQAEVYSRMGGIWQAVSGVEVYHDGLRSEGPPEGAVRYPAEAQAAMGAVYTHHSLDLLKLKLSFSGRLQQMLQRLPGEDAEIAPLTWAGSLAGQYPLSRAVVLSSSLYRGSRHAALSEQEARFWTESGLEMPGDSLGSEQRLSTEIGLKAQSGTLRATLFLFRTLLRDRYGSEAGSFLGMPLYAGQPVQARSQEGPAHVQGIEAAAEWDLLPALLCFAVLNYTQTMDLRSDRPLRHSPPLNGRLGLRFQSRPGIQGMVEWRYAAAQRQLSPADAADPRTLPGAPGWSSVNLRLSYRFAAGWVQVSLVNLFDVAYRPFGSGLDGRGRTLLLSLQIGRR